jgi:hypothetical protein
VTSAEISYREGCVRRFDWRVRRRAQLEEEARNHQQEVEREERERRQQLEQGRSTGCSMSCFVATSDGHPGLRRCRQNHPCEPSDINIARHDRAMVEMGARRSRWH